MASSNAAAGIRDHQHDEALTRVTVTSSGSYAVTISNSVGSVTSSVASVSVALPPSVTLGAVAGNFQLAANTYTGLLYVVESSTN